MKSRSLEVVMCAKCLKRSFRGIGNKWEGKGFAILLVVGLRFCKFRESIGADRQNRESRRLEIINSFGDFIELLGTVEASVSKVEYKNQRFASVTL